MIQFQIHRFAGDMPEVGQSLQQPEPSSCIRAFQRMALFFSVVHTHNNEPQVTYKILYILSINPSKLQQKLLEIHTT